MDFFNELYIIFCIALIITFIMFVTRGIVKDFHIRTKGFVYLIVSSVLLILMVIAYIVDNYILFFELYLDRVYFYFMGVDAIYLISAIIMLIKSKKFARPTKQKVVYTYREKVEFIYLLFRYENSLYLLKDTNAGIKYKMKKTEFVDDVLKRISSEIKVELYDEYERRGTITVKGEKKDELYYCYLVEISKPISNENLLPNNIYGLSKLECDQFDKYIVLKCLTARDFNDIY